MGLSSLIVSDIFSLGENSFYNLRLGVTINRQNIRTRKSVQYNLFRKTVSTIGAILQNALPAELKNAESLKIFKQKVKLWSPNDCPCKICRKFVKNLGYIQHQKQKQKKLIDFKAFLKKTCCKFSKVNYLQIVQVIIHFVIIIVSYLSLIRLQFVGLGFRQIKSKYIQYNTTQCLFQREGEALCFSNLKIIVTFFPKT